MMTNGILYSVYGLRHRRFSSREIGNITGPSSTVYYRKVLRLLKLSHVT